MRITSRSIALPIAAFLLLGAVLAALPQGGSASPAGADAPREAERPESALRSSLQLGPAFDEAAKQSFFEGLSERQRAAAIRLHARFALADPTWPLPGAQRPTEPFYLQLRGDMDGTMLTELRTMGVRWIGYFYRHTYILRATDAQALERLRAWLPEQPAVLGTLRRRPMDVCDPTAWHWLNEAQVWDAPRDARVMFHDDVEPTDAEQWLNTLGVEWLDATRDEFGRLTLATRYVDVRLTHAMLAEAAVDPRIAYLEPLFPLETHNSGSVQLSRANVVKASPYSLTGAGEIIAIWDGGAVQSTHPDFGGRVTLSTGAGISSHATHVMGTILGTGANNSSARGFAHDAVGFSYSFNSNIPVGRRSRRHLSLHVIDNHSYGSTGAAWGGYNGTARTADIDNRDLLIIQVQSAGNSGPGDTTIRADKGTKNDFIVAAATNVGNLANFSSRGPMLDGRLAPRIAGKGQSVLSAVPMNSYGTASGTSMSSPSVAGGLTLLSQYFKQQNENMPLVPDVALAVAAQTAIDRGSPGPNYQFGFGILDVEAAVQFVEKDAISGGRHILRGIARQGSTAEYVFDVHDSSTPIVATLAWLDEAANTGTHVVQVNDLDLELVAPDGTVFFPFSGLTSAGSQGHQFTQHGPNRRDNVEKAIVHAPAVGTWRMRVVSHSIPDPFTDYGFVLASSHALDRKRVRFVEPIGVAGIPLPDGAHTGWEQTFHVSATEAIEHVRAYVYVTHQDRNDIWITLTSPDNTTVELERGVPGVTHGRTDLIAVLPDTRHFHDNTAPFYGKSAEGTWRLTVSDRDADGRTGSLRFAALEFELEVPNEDPVVTVTGGGIFEIGEPVNLVATADDPDGHLMTFEWDQLTGPALPLSSDTDLSVTLTTPFVTTITDFAYRFTARDGRGGEGSDVAVVRVLPPNNTPIARAGDNRNVLMNQNVILDGSGSTDPDGDELTYFWQQIAGPEVDLSNPSNPIASFIAPGIPRSELVFEVTVDDGRGGVDSATVTIGVIRPEEPRGCGQTVGGTSAALPIALLAALLAMLAVRRRRAVA